MNDNPILKRPPPGAPGKWFIPVKHLGDGVDRGRIRKLMRERGESVGRLAALWGISFSTVYRKLDGRYPFYAKDIQFIKDHYSLSTGEAVLIFFNKII